MLDRYDCWVRPPNLCCDHCLKKISKSKEQSLFLTLSTLSPHFLVANVTLSCDVYICYEPLGPASTNLYKIFLKITMIDTFSTGEKCKILITSICTRATARLNAYHASIGAYLGMLVILECSWVDE